MKKSFKKVSAILLSLIIVFGIFSVAAHAEGVVSGKAGENVTWSFDPESGTLTIDGSGAMNDYYYSESDNKPSPWFDYAFQIKKVDIGDAITRIGDYAFYYCYYLKDISIPNSVKSIGTCAFESTGMYYDKSFWNNGVFTIGDCIIGTDIYSSLPNGDFQIPEGIRLVAETAFLYKGFSSISIPASVENIGRGAFLYVYGLETISVSEENKNYNADGVILYNKDKTELCAYLGDDRDAYTASTPPTVFEVPAQVTRIGDGAFAGCTNFKEIKLPDGLKSIGYDAFDLCSALETVSFPSSLTTIEGYAFELCSKLKTVEFPESLTSVGEHAFALCDGLESVTFLGKTTNIGEYCFAHCESLVSAMLPEENTEIADYIFQDCTALKSFTFSNSVTVIGFGALSYCSSLETVTIPKSVQKICAGAFYDCNALSTVDYLGTESEWKTLKENIQSYNDPLLSATINTAPGIVHSVSVTDLSIDCGSSAILDTKIDADEGAEYTVVYSTSDPTVATVDDSGKVEGVGAGTATITVTVTDKNENVVTDTCTVTVKPRANVINVTLDDISIGYKTSEKLNPVISADEGAEYTVSFSSSNPSTVKVDNNGKVTSEKQFGFSRGSAVITVIVTDSYGNSVSDTCNVTIKFSFVQWIIKIALFGWIWY